MSTGDDHDAKKRALARHGTLHPRPEDVTEDLFERDEFFDPRDAVQVKYEMLRRVRTDGWPVSRAACAYGYSRPTFYEAKEAFESKGMPGLLPSKKGPRRAHKLTGEVIDFIEERLAEEPRASMDDLARQVHVRFGLDVHPRSIGRALRRREKKTP
jgi:transposase